MGRHGTSLKKSQNETILFSRGNVMRSREANCCFCVPETRIPTPFGSPCLPNRWAVGHIHSWVPVSLSGHEYSHNPLAPIPVTPALLISSKREGGGGLSVFQGSSSIPSLKEALAWSPHEMISLSRTLSENSKPRGLAWQKTKGGGGTLIDL